MSVMNLRTTRRVVLVTLATSLVLLAGCDVFSGGEDILSTATPTATSTPTATPTAATKSASTATAAASTATGSPAPTGTAAGTGTASAGQTARLRGALGVDHPPFARDYGITGRSIGLACVSGIPTNGLVTITIGGTAGAPPAIIGSAGADGTVIVPFPIQQFGSMNGAITSLRINGQPAGFTADPFAYTVDSPDLICAPPR